jgi:hypothetical protein
MSSGAGRHKYRFVLINIGRRSNAGASARVQDGSSALTRSGKVAGNSARNCRINIGVFKDNVWGFAAQFQRHALHLGGGRCINTGACLVRPSESDFRHIRTIAAPTSWPYPVTTLKTPGGKPASTVSAANSRVEAEANSDGFSTTEQPAAIAGAAFQQTKSNGEFYAVNAPTTPKGSCEVKTRWSGLSTGITLPSTLSARPA